MAIIGKPIFVGEGMNWEVYHIDCYPVDINGKSVTTGVIKKRITDFPFENYVQKYESIKGGNLPTLTFCVEASLSFEEYKGCHAVFCQDLNLQFPEKIYVSPNTARDKEKCMKSKSEAYFVTKKFCIIENFESFLSSSDKILRKVANTAYFEDDAVFFVVVLKGNGIIEIEDFVIADLDTVGNDEDHNITYQEHVFEVLEALWFFCKYFESGNMYINMVYEKQLEICKLGN